MTSYACDREGGAAAQLDVVGVNKHILHRRARHGDGQRDVGDVFVVSGFRRGGHGDHVVAQLGVVHRSCTPRLSAWSCRVRGRSIGPTHRCRAGRQSRRPVRSQVENVPTTLPRASSRCALTTNISPRPNLLAIPLSSQSLASRSTGGVSSNRPVTRPCDETLMLKTPALTTSGVAGAVRVMTMVPKRGTSARRHFHGDPVGLSRGQAVDGVRTTLRHRRIFDSVPAFGIGPRIDLHTDLRHPAATTGKAPSSVSGSLRQSTLRSMPAGMVVALNVTSVPAKRCPLGVFNEGVNGNCVWSVGRLELCGLCSCHR